jgi:hypothetical protein
MLNLAIQLQALYEGRKEDVAALLEEEEDGGEKGSSGRGREVGK